MNNIQISTHFHLREFQCKDGSFQVVVKREMLVSRTLSGVKLAATDANLLQAASALAMLQTKTLKHVNRIDRAELIEA